MPAIVIDERDAIPVRLIPFITGWDWSPDILVSIIAKKRYTIALDTYYLTPNGRIQRMLPNEWDTIAADLEAISASLKRNDNVENENYGRWREASVRTLPAGAFVWLEELTGAYQETLPDPAVVGPENRSRPEDRVLNLSPFIPSSLRNAVYEGFEAYAPPATTAPAVKDPQTPAVATSSRAIAKAKTQQRYRDWQKRLDDMAKQYPLMTHKRLCEKIAMEDIAQGFSAETIRKNTRLRRSSARK